MRNVHNMYRQHLQIYIVIYSIYYNTFIIFYLIIISDSVDDRDQKHS